MRTQATVLVLCLTAAAAVACTADPPHPAAPSTSDAAPVQVNDAIPQELRAKAIAYAGFRAIDACGMHDPKAAEKITGDKGDQIAPAARGLNQCSLDLNKSEFESTWSFQIDVGDDFGADRRREAAPEDIAGMRVFRRESDRNCELVRPLDDEYGIRLTVSPRTARDQPPPKPACDVAREYVKDTAELWKTPPQRGAGRTSPDLPLGRVDPCDALSAALADLGGEPVMRPRGPYECQAKAKNGVVQKGQPPNEISVTLGADTDPTVLLTLAGSSSKEYKGADIAGSKAVLMQSKTGCRTEVIYKPEISLIADARAEDATPTYQVVEVRTASCDIAPAITEKIMNKIGGR
ncbi:hypothetical protein Lesp02_03710 [Lentzea sp. NBRC 105346]|uniref:hypothetical protein n=1 Tax=Lentzea sp. NBRC 105346 TaxID=3032205 RepID=UPI0024A1188F|nr:hypothetical protein [Lentzea sp. NBRC 105346]GLZ28181.1 hypothetical protein Lesp02_03710 [Lentzea sp. NBRC 105346]